MSQIQNLIRHCSSVIRGPRFAPLGRQFERLYGLRRIQCGLVIALLLAVSSSNSTAGTSGTWINPTGGLWSDSANWSGGTIADGTDSIADFSTLDITADNTAHLDSPRTIGGLVFGDSTPSNNWTLDNNGNSANVLTLGVGLGSPTIEVNNQTATISAIIGGNQGLTISGSGRLILSGEYPQLTGPTTISAGSLQLGNANAVQASTVAVNGFGGFLFTPGIGTFNLGGLSGSRSFSLSDTSGGEVTLQVGSDNADTTYTGAMIGSIGSLTKVGTGNLTLTGFNKFGLGGLTVNSGTVTLAGANGYSAPSTVNGGTLLLGNANALQFGTAVINVDGGLTFQPGIGTFTLGGLSGSHNITLDDTNGAPITLQLANNFVNSSYAGVMSGSGSLLVKGGGTLTLTGANTFSGGTTISSFLQLGNTNALQNSTVIVNEPLTFTPSVGTFTLGGLSGSYQLSLTDTKGAAITLQVGNNNADTTYSGPLSGVGSLTKSGTGTITLSDAGHFGVTNINAGVLQLAGSTSNSTISVNVDGGLAFAP